MVERHRQHVHVELIQHPYLQHLASTDTRLGNREILIRAKGMK
jgi:hypothetical protein